jgi:nitrite reductase (NO-forming)
VVSADTSGQQGGGVSYTSDVNFTLETTLGGTGLAYKGKGGEVDGVLNPELKVRLNDTVQVTVLNGDGVTHDVAFPDFGAKADHVVAKGASSTTVFKADREGTFAYYCTLPGHRQAGMEGKLIVGSGAPAAPAVSGSTIVRVPTDLPGPLDRSEPAHVRIDLEAREVTGNLADGTTYNYWTFNGAVPGPFFRVRSGDTVDVHMKNVSTSTMIHSVDFHAVTGPGGGAAVTQLAPGAENSFTFKALNPGLYVYHCATPMVANHITNGMYGLILVEPPGGLPKVDREFYVMQGEIYTHSDIGTKGHQEFDVNKLLDEQPEYFVLNGAVGSLTAQYPLKARVGETVRIYFGVGGPNFTSAFHVIGEIFDTVYDQASLTGPALTDVQTTLVPPGGATAVEFKLEVPGRYILVDHALSRLERGLAGFLIVEGEANPEVFDGKPLPSGGSGGH